MTKVFSDNVDKCNVVKCYIDPVTEPVKFRFAAIGDFGDTSDTQDVADMIESFNPDFIITLGDNNYSGLSTAAAIDDEIGQFFSNYIGNYKGAYSAGARKNAFFPCIGNHDWIGGSIDYYLDYFALPGIDGSSSYNERYYNFTWGNTEFFALSSDAQEPDGITSTSDQGKWLQNALSSSLCEFKIVYMHHHAYGSDTSHTNNENTDLRWPFKEWGADIVLSGHLHLYERLEIDDFPYIVIGNGGQSLRTGTDETGTLKKYYADFGATIVDVEDNKISFRHYNKNSVLIDSFSISRGREKRISVHDRRNT